MKAAAIFSNLYRIQLNRDLRVVARFKKSKQTNLISYELDDYVTLSVTIGRFYFRIQESVLETNYRYFYAQNLFIRSSVGITNSLSVHY